MHRAQRHRRAARHLRKKKGIMSSLKGVPHPSGRARSRLYCKLQMWMWRMRKEKCRFGLLRAKKKACRVSFSPCLGVKMHSQKHKGRDPTHHTPHKENSDLALPLGVAGGSGDSLIGKNGLPKLRETIIFTSSSQNMVTDTVVPTGDGNQTLPSGTTDTLLELGEMAEPSKLPHIVKLPLLSPDNDTCALNTHSGDMSTVEVCQKPETDRSSGQFSTTTPGPGPGPGQAANGDTEERLGSKKAVSFPSDVSFKVLTKDIHEFLDDFSRKYGSFIPLQKSDVLRHLKRKLNTDFSERKNLILSEVTKYRAATAQKPPSSFRVVYKKHTLTLEDLSTLADQNWLNDQVMNMYGELIMEAAHHKVHFHNSFFHRQLMTKGYDGVKRWTKQVDLFSKSFLLVPIHLEVHWCLVTADMVKKKICLYDSQGNALLKVARNILKYLMTEAKEKKQTAFENGWVVSFDEKIPQQTNENDCGVFVLEYSRCLALAKPLQFSQKDIPKIRKRIYKELCDRKLHEQ